MTEPETEPEQKERHEEAAQTAPMCLDYFGSDLASPIQAADVSEGDEIRAEFWHTKTAVRSARKETVRATGDSAGVIYCHSGNYYKPATKSRNGFAKNNDMSNGETFGEAVYVFESAAAKAQREQREVRTDGGVDKDDRPADPTEAMRVILRSTEDTPDPEVIDSVRVNSVADFGTRDRSVVTFNQRLSPAEQTAVNDVLAGAGFDLDYTEQHGLHESRAFYYTPTGEIAGNAYQVAAEELAAQSEFSRFNPEKGARVDVLYDSERSESLQNRSGVVLNTVRDFDPGADIGGRLGIRGYDADRSRVFVARMYQDKPEEWPVYQYTNELSESEAKVLVDNLVRQDVTTDGPVSASDFSGSFIRLGIVESIRWKPGHEEPISPPVGASGSD